MRFLVRLLASAFLFCTPGVVAAEATSQRSAGVVLRSADASIGGSSLLPGQTVLAGDALEVQNGAAEIALGNGNRVTLGPETRLTFSREPSAVTAVLDSGNLAFASTAQSSGFAVRIDEVLVAPVAGARTRALISLSGNALVIAPSEGAVMVDAHGQRVNLLPGKAARFMRDTAGGSGAGASTVALGGRRIPWGRVMLCGTAGAALGSVPVILRERLASADSDWRWGVIPAGTIGGGLICYSITPPPGYCTLTAQPSDVKLGEPVTLSWTSPPGYTDNLTGVGAEPPSGSTTVVPAQTGTNRWTLTAQGPLGTLVCDARAEVKAPAPKPPTCQLWYTIDETTKQITLNWTSENATTSVLEGFTLPGAQPPPVDSWPQPQADVPKGTRDVPAESRYYKMTVTGAQGTRDGTCNVPLYIPSCSDFTSEPLQRPSTGFLLRWKWENVGKYELDPKLDPARKEKTDQLTSTNGRAYVFPKDETTYLLTVKRKLPVDSRRPGGKTVEFDSTCDTTASPVSCTIEVVDPKTKQVDASKAKPARVSLEWASEKGVKAVLKTYVNAKLTDTQADPPKPKVDKNVAETSEFVLTVTGPGGEVATCRDCILNRPEDGKGKVLDIPPVFQKNSMWCWLTVGQMIFQYLPNSVPDFNPWQAYKKEPPATINPDKRYQWGILAALHPECWLSPDACAMKGGGSWDNVQRMLRQYPGDAGKQKGGNFPAIKSTQVKGCLDKDAIKREIDAGRPIIAGISPGLRPAPPGPPPAPNAQHVALIIGYQEKDGKFQIIVNDPWPYKYRPNDPNPYIKAGGSQNCESNYTLNLQDFCEKAGWQGSLTNITK